MAKAKNEAEVLRHMEVQFRAGKGLLSGKLPQWTQAKLRALKAAIEDARNFAEPEDIAEAGILDLGIGDQKVMEAFIHVAEGTIRYVGIEGCRRIFEAGLARTERWGGEPELIHASFGEFVSTDFEEVGQPAVVAALDVIYHIPDDDLYEEFLARVFEVAGTHVVITHALDVRQVFSNAKGPGGNGFGWFPRHFEVPEGWEVIYSEDSQVGTQKQRVLALRRIA